MDDDLGVMLASLLRAYHAAVTPRLDDVPHGARGYQTLREVVRGDQPSQLALATRLGIDRTVMTYLIDDLSEAGLVERRPNPDDRRQRKVVATPAGAQRVEELCQHVRGIEESLLGSLSVTERDQFRVLLGRAAGGADREAIDACEVVEKLVPVD
ncbi:MarR family winged helix-turn-helix transcriptional regulator [Pseudactinotalea sp.]|uniref:MarR family winged helix-turn-helix transcriptional regulator n=1 Tax=Pseudactinotalea sp. TaxID=1926260 RepID=UPI003B39FC25